MNVEDLQRQINEAYRFTDRMKGDYESLRNAALSISSELARAGWLKAEARRTHAQAKADVAAAEDALKQVDASLYLEYRTSLDGGVDSKGKPKLPTEATIQASILTSAEHEVTMGDLRDVRLAEIDAQHLVDLTWDLVEALKVRATMLNSLSADRRAELSTDQLLRQQAREAAEDRETE